MIDIHPDRDAAFTVLADGMINGVATSAESLIEQGGVSCVRKLAGVKREIFPDSGFPIGAGAIVGLKKLDALSAHDSLLVHPQIVSISSASKSVSLAGSVRKPCGNDSDSDLV